MPQTREQRGTKDRKGESAGGRYAPGERADDQKISNPICVSSTLLPATQTEEILLGADPSCVAVSQDQNGIWHPQTTLSNDVMVMMRGLPDGSTQETNEYAAVVAATMLNNQEVRPHHTLAIEAIQAGTKLARTNMGILLGKEQPGFELDKEPTQYATVRARACQLACDEYIKRWPNKDKALQEAFDKTIDCTLPVHAISPDVMMADALSYDEHYTANNSQLLRNFVSHQAADGYSTLTRPRCVNEQHDHDSADDKPYSKPTRLTRCTIYGQGHMYNHEPSTFNVLQYVIGKDLVSDKEVRQALESLIETRRVRPESWYHQAAVFTQSQHTWKATVAHHQTYYRLLEVVGQHLNDMSKTFSQPRMTIERHLGCVEAGRDAMLKAEQAIKHTHRKPLGLQSELIAAVTKPIKALSAKQPP